jgi:hypothetical protein
MSAALFPLLFVARLMHMLPSLVAQPLPSSAADRALFAVGVCARSYVGARAASLLPVTVEYVFLLATGLCEHASVNGVALLDTYRSVYAALPVRTAAPWRWLLFGGTTTRLATAMSLMDCTPGIAAVARGAAAAAAARGGSPTAAAWLAVAWAWYCQYVMMLWLFMLVAPPLCFACFTGLLWPWDADARIASAVLPLFAWLPLARGEEDGGTGCSALFSNLALVQVIALAPFGCMDWPAVLLCVPLLLGGSVLAAHVVLRLVWWAHPHTMRSEADADAALLRAQRRFFAPLAAAAAWLDAPGAGAVALATAAWRGARSRLARIAARWAFVLLCWRAGCASAAWFLRRVPLPRDMVACLVLLLRALELYISWEGMLSATHSIWQHLRVDRCERSIGALFEARNFATLPAADQEAVTRHMLCATRAAVMCDDANISAGVYAFFMAMRGTAVQAARTHAATAAALQHAVRGREDARAGWLGLPCSTRALACAVSGIAAALLMCAAWMARGALYGLMCMLFSSDVRWAVGCAWSRASRPLSPLLRVAREAALPAAQLVFSHRRKLQGLLAAACGAGYERMLPAGGSLRTRVAAAASALLRDLRALPRACLVRLAWSACGI